MSKSTFGCHSLLKRGIIAHSKSVDETWLLPFEVILAHIFVAIPAELWLLVVAPVSTAESNNVVAAHLQFQHENVRISMGA